MYWLAKRQEQQNEPVPFGKAMCIGANFDWCLLEGTEPPRKRPGWDIMPAPSGLYFGRDRAGAPIAIAIIDGKLAATPSEVVWAIDPDWDPASQLGDDAPLLTRSVIDSLAIGWLQDHGRYWE